MTRPRRRRSLESLLLYFAVSMGVGQWGGLLFHSLLLTSSSTGTWRHAQEAEDPGGGGGGIRVGGVQAFAGRTLPRRARRADGRRSSSNLRQDSVSVTAACASATTGGGRESLTSAAASRLAPPSNHWPDDLGAATTNTKESAVGGILELFLGALDTNTNHQHPASTRRDLLRNSMGMAMAATTATNSLVAAAWAVNDDIINTSGVRQQQDPSAAAAFDLTTQLFNPDGSIKDKDADVEAKSRLVSFQWQDVAPNSNNNVAVNGKNTTPKQTTPAAGSSSLDASSSFSSSVITLSYNLPAKWSADYIDTSVTTTTSSSSSAAPKSNNSKRCQRIVVYQVPGPVSADRLAQATRMGVAEALEFPAVLDNDSDTNDNAGNTGSALAAADIIGGRSFKIPVATGNDSKQQQVYYEFDLAVAPKTCSGQDADDLRLGFCPYERIILLSATLVPLQPAENSEQQQPPPQYSLYVCSVEATKDQWKQSNAELRRIRSSFRVVRGATAATVV